MILIIAPLQKNLYPILLQLSRRFTIKVGFDVTALISPLNFHRGLSAVTAEGHFYGLLELIITSRSRGNNKRSRSLISEIELQFS